MTGGQRYFAQQAEQRRYRFWLAWYTARSGPMALWMLLGFLVLSAMDAYTTLVSLDLGGGEGNPFMRPLLARGAVTFWLVKMTLAVAAAVLLEVAYLYKRRVGFRIISGVYLFQLLIVLNNIAVIGRLS